MAHKKLDQVIVIDLETTCEENDPSYKGEIIEIGISRFDIRKWEIIRCESIFVTPVSTQITEFCTKLTGITAEKVDPANGAVSLPVAIRKLISDYEVHHRTWGSWGNFDRNQFERQCGSAYPFKQSHINIKNLYSLKFFLHNELSLVRAMEHANLTFEGRNHSGADDAYNTACLLRRILA